MKMKWLSQFSLVMRSSISSLKEMVEDPERMLHQLIIDMGNELQDEAFSKLFSLLLRKAGIEIISA